MILVMYKDSMGYSQKTSVGCSNIFRREKPPGKKGVCMAKKVLWWGLLFSVMVLGSAAAQNTLREGVYQAQGSADEYYVNADYNYKRYKKGYYTLQGFMGSAKNKKAAIVVSGSIVGNELRTNVNKADARAFAEALGEDVSINIPDGALLVYYLVDSETFLDPGGQRWIWRRAKK
jgi:uncharacterized protein YejL (UPF0352 family)